MTEDDLKSIISTYQQKCFDLFNTNIVLETQVNKLSKLVEQQTLEIDKLKASKSRRKDVDEFS
jgi:hypothetical protein